MNIRIHYSFVIYLFILVFLNLIKYYLVFFISVLLHEFIHMIVGYIYGLKVKYIEFNISGINVDFENFNINYKKKIIIYIVGPVANLLIAGLAYYINKEKFIFFILANLGLCIFNLLPIYPLDGGKIMYEILKELFSFQISVIKKIYKIFQIFLLFILSYFCINYSNIQLFFLGIYFLKFTVQEEYKYIL